MKHSLEEDLAKVGTEQAKAEKEARIEMAKEDEKEVYSPERLKAEEIAAQAITNYSLLNFILTSHSLKGCRTPLEAVKLVFQYTMVHTNRVVKEYKFFRKICELHNIKDLLDEGDRAFYDEYIAHEPCPTVMAQSALEEVNRLARARSKANKYGIVSGAKMQREKERLMNSMERRK